MNHEQLRETRAELGLSQSKMAHLLACDLKTYQRWEADPLKPYARAVPPLVERVVIWIARDGYRPPEWLSMKGQL